FPLAGGAAKCLVLNTPAFSISRIPSPLNPAQLMTTMVYKAIGVTPSPFAGQIGDLPGHLARWRETIRQALGTVDGQLREPVLSIILPGQDAEAATHLTEDVADLIAWVKQET